VPEEPLSCADQSHLSRPARFTESAGLQKPIVIFPELLFGLQRRVPARFQCSGDTTVLRLDILILPFDAFCFVASVVQLSPPVAVKSLPFTVDIVGSTQTQFQRGRFEGLQDLFRDELIHFRRAHTMTRWRNALLEMAPAIILIAAAFLVSHLKALATATTADKSCQQAVSTARASRRLWR